MFFIIMNLQPIKQIHKVITWTIGTLIWGIIKINMEIIMTGIVELNGSNSILEEGKTKYFKYNTSSFIILNATRIFDRNL